MEFRTPKCKCKPGSGKLRWQPSIQLWTCGSCRETDSAVSPEDFSLFKKVKAMNNTMINENLKQGNLVSLLKLLLRQLVDKEPQELATVMRIAMTSKQEASPTTVESTEATAEETAPAQEKPKRQRKAKSEQLAAEATKE